MSNKARLRERAKSRELATSPAAPLQPAAFMGNGFQAADFARNSSMIYFPTLDTRKEITQYNRTEVLRKTRWAMDNLGFPRRIINGLSRMVTGTGLTPQLTTDDKKWNKEAYAYATRIMDSAYSYDLGGRYNGWKAQRAVKRFKFRDGDCGCALTRTAAGQPTHAFFEGHQIGGGESTDAQRWIDGVLVGPHNQAQAYRVLGADDTFAIIPARDFLFQCNFERGGQHRGMGIMHAMLNRMMKSSDILGYIAEGVKLANQFGYVIEDADPGTTAGGSGLKERVSGPTKKVDLPNGAGQITLEKIISGGGVIAELPPGKKIRFLSDSRPHPNNLQLLDYMIRDMSWSADMSPELLWNIASLGGANTRFVMADAQGMLESEQQDLVDQFCGPDLIYILAVGMATGRLRRCEDPNWMYKQKWIPPARLTVDFGRDGGLYIKQIKCGALTFKKLHGMAGNNSEEEREDWLDEMAGWRDGAVARGLDPTMVLATIYGSPGMGQVIAADSADNLDPNLDPNAADRFDADRLTDEHIEQLAKNPKLAEAVLHRTARVPMREPV